MRRQTRLLAVGPISPTSVRVIRRIAPLSDASERGREMDAMLFASGRHFHMSMEKPSTGPTLPTARKLLLVGAALAGLLGRESA